MGLDPWKKRVREKDKKMKSFTKGSGYTSRSSCTPLHKDIWGDSVMHREDKVGEQHTCIILEVLHYYCANPMECSALAYR